MAKFQPLDPSLAARLAALAGAADEQPTWPDESWELARRAGALRWSIPPGYGGAGAGDTELLQGYESLAAACLTSAFILSQRDAACRRILSSDKEELKNLLLPPLAAGEQFATVGLSQLTTSRQHGKPVFVARRDGDGFRLDGTIPWVTGAARAGHIVVGATLEGGGQVLLVLPADTPGVRVGGPMPLMALEGSLTAEIHCDGVRVGPRWLLAGPVEDVMKGPRGGAGGLQTSCLALGVAGAAVAYLHEEARSRPGLASGTERLARQRDRLRDEMYRLAESSPSPEAVTALRAQANTLVVQAGQAALIASKGTGFVRQHPAQRWVRQAMFFLVWSCPWPAASATLDYLTFRPDQECV